MDLTRPAGSGPAPVAVLLHGGYWRAQYTKRLMAPMAAGLAARGWAAANVEYRRVGLGGGGGGWPATFEDVAAAVDHLADVDGLDLDRVVTVGHSAGGHLALWAAGRHRLPPGTPGAGPVVAIQRAVSLAGVVDLVEADRLGLGAGAVPALLGGRAATVPGRYAVASPAALLPLGVAQVLVHGDADGVVPLGLSERYVSAAVAAGDDVRLVTLRGVDHMAVIQPRGAPWDALCVAIDGLS
jgi:acetyl esterase/lipase